MVGRGDETLDGPGLFGAPVKLLVVDDSDSDRRLIQLMLERIEGVTICEAPDGLEGLEQVAAQNPDLVLLDVNMPRMGGLEVLERLKSLRPELPVIILTGNADVKLAVQAIQLGAYQFLTKPVNDDELLVTLRRALERTEMMTELLQLRRKLRDGSALAAMLGASPGMQTVVRQIRQVASSNLTVLIQGETGVGKELVARAIHEESDRSAGPLVAIDCGALPENLAESELFGYEKGAFSGADRKKPGQVNLAEGGTLFLDEIGNLPLAMQAKLLRVLQERKLTPLGGTAARPIDVRFVAATNVPLESAPAERFRRDLFFRLAEFTIAIPPLRERRDDVVPLARLFREEATLELRRPVSGIETEATDLLLRHPWPGNVRELRNVIRRAVVGASDFTLRASDIRPLLVGPPRAADEPHEPSAAPSAELSLREIADEAVANAEKQAIVRALRSTQGNKTHAARLLKVDYKTLHLKIRRYGLTETNGGS